MRFSKFKKFNIILVIAAICITVSFNRIQPMKNDIYEYGDWWTTNEKASNQTWPEFWQAYLDNPYASESTKNAARWVIENGYANGDLATGSKAYADAGYPYDQKGSVSNSIPNKATEEKSGNNSKEKAAENVQQDDSANITADEEWIETTRVDATCTEDGEITYTEQNSGKTKTETIAALGHVKSKAEIVKEPTLFNKGEQVIKCTRCGEVLESEVLPEKVPMRIWAILFTSVIVVLVATIFFVKTMKKR